MNTDPDSRIAALKRIFAQLSAESLAHITIMYQKHLKAYFYVPSNIRREKFPASWEDVEPVMTRPHLGLLSLSYVRLTLNQCCKSESRSGRIRNFFPDPELFYPDSARMKEQIT